ncbi:MAE_28990/MAE_18760 family HEPN-like nuclease [Emticicia oligotrophica]|uniref:MAE_28990/MAE_18760 family HEPN-like nuclease n=1 Tax=Emticicia oligotrophica TaxID=312279 RepID=UPI00273C33E0|nr:MAE_28990/MAE_18760 family HEPN-like nuclease [Emticicia oligotrophica]
MEIIISEIQEDIKWRVNEITTLKTIPLRYNLQKNHQNSIIIYSIPAYYALWEGYLKNSFELLTNYINKLELDYSTVNVNLLTHAIENRCNLGNERKYFDKKMKSVGVLTQFYKEPFRIEQGVPTESNVNFKVTNRVLERFCIQSMDNKYEKPLDRLLLFRNKIAHGENSIKVKREDIDEFSLLVENLMYEILILIEKYIDTKGYLMKSN